MERKEIKELEVKDEIGIQELFKKAIEKDASIDTLERLMKIREDIKKEKAKEEFFQALGEFQKRLKPISTDSQVLNKDGTVRYRYASLKKIMQEIQPLLSECGFSISFETERVGSDVKVSCILKHIAGHQEKSSFVIPIETSNYMNDIQKMGSTLTYAKRYALMGVLNIIVEDSDTDANVSVIVEDTIKEEKIEKEKKFYLTQKQKNYIFYLCKEKGISNEKRKEILKELLGIESINQIKSQEDYEKLLNYLKEK